LLNAFAFIRLIRVIRYEFPHQAIVNRLTTPYTLNPALFAFIPPNRLIIVISNYLCGYNTMKPIQIMPILLICLVFFSFEPNDYYYHPWLEYPYYKPEMQGPLPPNSGTDDYEIIFNAVGPNPDSYLGWALCLAGDQNEDGFDDILAACFDPLEVRLYFGGDPMDTIPDVIFPVESASSIFFPLELSDLNADGGIDIVFGRQYDNFYQEVYVYCGGAALDTIKDWTLVSDNPFNAGFGYGMSHGDINDDELSDLIIGAPGYIAAGRAGKIFIYYGGTDFDSIPDYTITSGFNGFGDSFGGFVSASGDVNYDGINDFVSAWVIGLPIDLTGCYLFHGGVELDSIPDWTYELSYGSYMAWYATIIKDLNDDNYDEIALITYEGLGMETHLFFGSETLDNTPDLIIEGGGSGPRKCASAGDVNADGFNDIIFGNHDDDWVKVYFGGDPMDVIADITFYMNLAGSDVDFAGDVNNDGIHDFMFFANDDAGLDAGQILIYSDPSLTPHVEPRYNDNHPTAFTLGQTVYFNSFDCIFGENVRVLWDGKDLSGNVLPSGLYFAELTAEDYREAIKMEILR